MLEVASDDTSDGHDDGYSALLVRRHRYTGQLSFSRCWTPGPAPLSRLIALTVARWRIEEDHQLSKQSTGLDSGQVIRWTSWHRWTAICLLSYLYLAVAVASQRQHEAGSEPDTGLIQWLLKHPRFHLHFTPTSSSWLNLAELITRKLRRVTSKPRCK